MNASGSVEELLLFTHALGKRLEEIRGKAHGSDLRQRLVEVLQFLLPADAARRRSPKVARSGPVYAKLVDISRCIGCKGCEVACKEWNDLKVEPTVNFGSYQSHQDLSPNTWLLMRFNEVEVNDQLQWLIKKDACLHCEEPGCLFALPRTWRLSVVR